MKYAKTLLATALATTLVTGCASSKPKSDIDPSELIRDALISFTVSAQAARYNDALQYVTEDEQLQMITPDGAVREDFQLAMSRARLREFQVSRFELDSDGKLVGMVRILKDINLKAVQSDEQRQMNLDKVSRMPMASAPMDAESSATDPQPDSSVISVPAVPETQVQEEDTTKLTIDELFQ